MIDFKLVAISELLVLFTVSIGGFHIADRELPQERIVKGEDINITQIPYMAHIKIVYEDDESISTATCSGTIIDELWILTAAHCVNHQTEVTVFTGAQKSWPRIIREPVKKHLAVKIIVHENYHEFDDKDTPPLNDIALIKLSKPIEFDNYRQPIPIALSTDIPEAGEKIVMSGYGRNSRFDSLVHHRPLKYLNQTVVGETECKKSYPTEDISLFFCTKAADGSGTCKGDSGGPGVMDGKVVGVMSFIFLDYCDTKYGPELYTRVHLFHDWIVDKMKETTATNVISSEI